MTTPAFTRLRGFIIQTKGEPLFLGNDRYIAGYRFIKSTGEFSKTSRLWGIPLAGCLSEVADPRKTED